MKISIADNIVNAYEMVNKGYPSVEYARQYYDLAHNELDKYITTLEKNSARRDSRKDEWNNVLDPLNNKIKKLEAAAADEAAAKVATDKAAAADEAAKAAADEAAAKLAAGLHAADMAAAKVAMDKGEAEAEAEDLEAANPNDKLVEEAEEKIEKISKLIEELIGNRDITDINKYYNDNNSNFLKTEFSSLSPYIYNSTDKVILTKIKNIIYRKLVYISKRYDGKRMEYLLYFILTVYNISNGLLEKKFRSLTKDIDRKYKLLFEELLISTPYFIKNNWCNIRNKKEKGNNIPVTCKIQKKNQYYDVDRKFLNEFKEILGLESRGGKRKTVKKINKRKSVNSIKKSKTKKKSRKKKPRKSVKKSIKKKRKTLRKTLRKR